jgi:hypothetical protein
MQYLSLAKSAVLIALAVFHLSQLTRTGNTKPGVFIYLVFMPTFDPQAFGKTFKIFAGVGLFRLL